MTTSCSNFSMRNTMLSLLSLVMIGCAPHAAQVVTPTYTAQKPVIERPSASPTVESARTKQAAADNSAAVTAAKVKQLSANLTDTEEKLSDSVTEVSRLEKQGSATKNELALLYDQLVALLGRPCEPGTDVDPNGQRPAGRLELILASLAQCSRETAN